MEDDLAPSDTLSDKECHISELYEDVLKVIFSFIPRDDRGWSNVMRTCKLWYEIGRKVFTPYGQDQHSLYKACERGLVATVEVLLKDPLLFAFHRDIEYYSKYRC